MLILCLIPDKNDATSYYRATGPLGHLRKNSDVQLSYHFSETIERGVLDICDVAFFQRPFADAHLQAVHKVKDNKLPIWVDYDDNLLCVPFDNDTCNVYNKPSVQKNIKEILEMADVVTVSTNFLKQQWKGFNKNIITIENGFNVSKFFKKWSLQNKTPENVIMWRGSPTHKKDMLTVAQEVVEMSHYDKEYRFEFMGDRHWMVTERMRPNSVTLAGPFDVDSYFKHIQSKTPKAFFVPLVKSDFNMSKSNIAWMEATLSGALTICTDMPEWVQPGVLRYKDPKDFKTQMKIAMEMDRDTWSMNVTSSWEKICDVYNLDHQNPKRLEMLKNLI